MTNLNTSFRYLLLMAYKCATYDQGIEDMWEIQDDWQFLLSRAIGQFR